MKHGAIVIGVVNSKGGVGKTTISSNISHILSVAGYKVLHADFDPQGSSSETFRAQDENGNMLTKDYILSLDIFKLLSEQTDTRKYIFRTAYTNLDIIPNAQRIDDIFMSGSFDVRFEKLENPNKHRALYYNLCQVQNDYDYIIIDGQPNINSMMEISIIASDYVLSPAAPDIYNFSTVNNTCGIIDYCNQQYGRDTEYLGFFLNGVSDLKDGAYSKLIDFYTERAKEYFIDIPIRYSKVVNKSRLSGMPWLEYGLNETVTLPNPCKDLLSLLYNELNLIDEEHKERLIELSKDRIKKEYFERR